MSLDLPQFTQIGDATRLILRAMTFHDWFFGSAIHALKDVALPERAQEYLEAANRAAAITTETAVRIHTALQLHERDAFLQRPSVQLSDRLKQEARMAPFNHTSLFGGTIEALAEKSATNRQSEIVLFDRKTKPASAKPKAPASASVNKSQPKQKPYKRPKGKGQASQSAAKQPFTFSAKGSGAPVPRS